MRFFVSRSARTSSNCSTAPNAPISLEQLDDGVEVLVIERRCAPCGSSAWEERPHCEASIPSAPRAAAPAARTRDGIRVLPPPANRRPRTRREFRSGDRTFEPASAAWRVRSGPSRDSKRWQALQPRRRPAFRSDATCGRPSSDQNSRAIGVTVSDELAVVAGRAVERQVRPAAPRGSARAAEASRASASLVSAEIISSRRARPCGCRALRTDRPALTAGVTRSGTSRTATVTNRVA